MCLSSKHKYVLTSVTPLATLSDAGRRQLAAKKKLHYLNKVVAIRQIDWPAAAPREDLWPSGWDHMWHRSPSHSIG